METDELEKPQEKKSIFKKSPLIYFLIVLCLASTLFSIFFYRYKHDYAYSVYLSVPLLIAWITAQFYPKKTMGKAIQIALFILCVIAPLLGEGLICIVFITPFILVLVVLFVAIFESIFRFKKALKGEKENKDEVKNKTLKSLAILPLLLLFPHLEKPISSSGKTYLIQDSILLNASKEKIWHSLNQLEMEMNFSDSWVFALGVPEPTKIEVKGKGAGSERRVHFKNGTVVAKVIEQKEGEWMRIQLSFENPGHEFFDRWIKMEQMMLSLEGLPDGKTKMKHEVYYQRLLPFEWYLGSLEKWSAHHIQQYMLDNFQKFAEQKG